MDIATIVLVIGACLRLTRLFIFDDLPPLPYLRRQLAQKVGAESSWWTLATCPWCLSAWVGGLVILSAHFWGHTFVWRLLAGALTLSLVTGTYETIMTRLED